VTAFEDAVIGAPCPRCGATIPAAMGAGRPRRWCSDRCRRLAYDERRAAKTGAVGIEFREPARAPEVVEVVTERVVSREIFVPPTPYQAGRIVLGSPRACRDLLLDLAAKTRTGELGDNRHKATVNAAITFLTELRNAGLLARR
jgi:endogenous inhibitor of DNA gyrase (YacG/DUF329 family)